MFGFDTALAILSKHGLWALAPIAVLEGPIVTVIAAWLASQNLFSLWAVVAVVVLADLLGDLIFYAMGRFGILRLPAGLRRRLGLRPARLRRLGRHFDAKGTRTLIIGKLTHSAGAAVLVAAGMGRMPLWRFVMVNLAATLPKSLFFVALGYGLGANIARIDDWIGRGSLIVLVLILALSVACFLPRKVLR